MNVNACECCVCSVYSPGVRQMLGGTRQPKDAAVARPGGTYQLGSEAGGGASQLQLPGPPQGVERDETTFASPHPRSQD